LAIHAKNQIISFEALYTWILSEKPLREWFWRTKKQV
jgi:hypothetical protein